MGVLAASSLSASVTVLMAQADGFVILKVRVPELTVFTGLAFSDHEPVADGFPVWGFVGRFES